ncbi:MAG: S-layer homology domain-containing protein, partial [Acidimicrobiales bacterium]
PGAARPPRARSPTSAAARLSSDCPPGSLCTDGYTDFCCLLTGENLCPPGTVVAGWWKADGSGFCDIDGPRPRYYLDCNLDCASGCGCGAGGICDPACTSADCRCADGCDSRMLDCTRFRYGQCNQHIPCVGPIQCRIITCVPPWKWDPSCTPAVATDSHTRFHDRPCLHDGFTDVSPRAFYTDAVAWMVAQGITSGFNDDLFGPEEPTERAQFAAFIWRYGGRPGGFAPSRFVDVADDAYYAPAVAWMVANGITTGSSATEFAPERVINRAEAVTFLWRLAGQPPPGPWEPFDDVPDDAFFRDAVAWAAQFGITTGLAPNIFGPTLVLTRGEAATFLHRFELSERGTRVL